MPELPEVESARAVIERSALHRTIRDVDDTDTWVCRPHGPGELRDALIGHQLTAAHRRGKSIWCDTGGGAPTLGIHLGMSGRIHVTSPGEADDEGGDYVGTGTRAATYDPAWDRFTLVFEGGGMMRLFDKRRLGRVRLDPDIDALGPDAGEVGVAEFRELVARSGAPVKARLLDQHAVAGIGNLLADEALWQAAIDPGRRATSSTHDELTRLHRAVRTAIRRAIKKGGVHTGEIIGHRRAGEHCPRCGRADGALDRRRPDHLALLAGAGLSAGLTSHRTTDRASTSGPPQSANRPRGCRQRAEQRVRARAVGRTADRSRVGARSRSTQQCGVTPHGPSPNSARRRRPPTDRPPVGGHLEVKTSPPRLVTPARAPRPDQWQS